VLQFLAIRNLATIESLEVVFRPGFNVVTGETGAGKSIVLGALQTLLGERAEKSLIRAGADACEITARFRLDAAGPALGSVEATLAAAGAPACEGGELLLRRVITAGATQVFANCSPVTLRLMRTLGELLLDIHGPNDHQSLLSPRCQLDLLDTFGGHDGLRRQCQAAHAAAAAARHRLDALRQDQVSPADAEILRHQLAEIERAGLRPDEEGELTARHRVAANARRLLELASQCRSSLTEGDDAVCDRLGPLVRQLEELAGLIPDPGARLLAGLEGAIESLRELAGDLEQFAAGLDSDEGELARIEERLALIHGLRRRYGADVAGILERAAALRGRLDDMENRHEVVAAAEAAVAAADAELRAVAERLSAGRAKAAPRLAAAIAAKLGRLGFARGRFEAQLAAAPLGPHGADGVEFCFAPNPGEAVLPLRKIASSGEIARVMLAVKTVLTAADPVPVLVFDEVDANIGGRVAATVAAELAAVAARHQVMCITHLPQIAAAGTAHFQVGKQIVRGRTRTTMAELDPEGRVGEIARMMGDSGDSATARAHAREMLAGQGTAPAAARPPGRGCKPPGGT